LHCSIDPLIIRIVQDLADITFNFWYRLSEFIYLRNDDELKATFQSYIERLVIALYRHCRFDPDHVRSYYLLSSSDFSEFRRLVAEVIKDVVFIIGSKSLFRTMFQCAKQNASWDETESVLFIMTAVAKNLIPWFDAHDSAIIAGILLFKVFSPVT
uniref:PXA domain-containing protein n=1 Tax=Soboliphyme baturini TaxID=241478 RepID=A0A183J8L0_9BILA